MLQTYFAARSVRPIAAFLITGSLMGFVVGQRLGHPAPVAHHPVVSQHASGGLGTPVVHPLSQPIPAAAPATRSAAPTSNHNGDHNHDQGGKHDKHGGGSSGGGGGGDGGGHGDVGGD